MSTVTQRLKNIFSLYFPPALWCGFIFYLSCQPDLKVSEGIWDLILRKIGHIAEYFILTILVARTAGGSIFRINKKSIILGALFSFFFAISDEYHQTFTKGRLGSPVDVGIDAAGIILATVFLKSFKFNRNKNV